MTTITKALDKARREQEALADANRGVSRGRTGKRFSRAGSGIIYVLVVLTIVSIGYTAVQYLAARLSMRNLNIDPPELVWYLAQEVAERDRDPSGEFYEPAGSKGVLEYRHREELQEEDIPFDFARATDELKGQYLVTAEETKEERPFSAGTSQEITSALGEQVDEEVSQQVGEETVPQERKEEDRETVALSSDSSRKSDAEAVMRLEEAMDHATGDTEHSDADESAADTHEKVVFSPETFLAELKVSGVLWDLTSPIVIINGEILKEGEMIGEMTVDEITVTTLRVDLRGNKYDIILK